MNTAENTAPLSEDDVRELETWADEIVRQADGWADRADASRHAELARALDAAATSARMASRIAAVILDAR